MNLTKKLFFIIVMSIFIVSCGPRYNKSITSLESQPVKLMDKQLSEEKARLNAEKKARLNRDKKITGILG